MNYWLLKTEPDTFSIDDLAREKITHWDGVRNYQARNFLMEMKEGEQALIYHSNAKPPAVVGRAVISNVAGPDPSQFQKTSPYFDPKATREKPRWFCPQIGFVEKFVRPVSLDRLREEKSLQDMALLQRGSRLSVHRLSEKQFNKLLQLTRS